ncbi:MAG: metallopeptidase family protein [Anaerolineae bacterium]
MLGEDAFEHLVSQALDDLPEWVQRHMDNVAVMATAWPSAAQLRAAGIGRGHLLIGLYEGVPLTHRGRGYQLVPPDRITLFQGPLEQVAASVPDLVRQIRHTVIHEVAHHYGLSDEEIAQLMQD